MSRTAAHTEIAAIQERVRNISAQLSGRQDDVRALQERLGECEGMIESDVAEVQTATVSVADGAELARDLARKLDIPETKRDV